MDSSELQLYLSQYVMVRMSRFIQLNCHPVGVVQLKTQMFWLFLLGTYIEF